MKNEFLLLASLIFLYSLVLLWFRLFGAKGLLCWTVLATISANIEVLILIDAFGISMTLGNVLFASTFLVTDILSETAGKEEAQKAVNIGVLTSVCFILISQYWLLYTPSTDDLIFPNMQTVFSNTPRLMLVGLLVYALVQRFDVWAYHKWWDFTSRRFNEKRSHLWLRNNGSTLISQALNSILFTFGAFWNIYPLPVLRSIMISSYLIFIVTSLADTPFVYLARHIQEKNTKSNSLQA